MSEVSLHCKTFLATALILASTAPLASPLTPLEAKGKALYTRGLGSNGKPLKAHIGEESTEVGADSVPCGSCHGEDGRGRPEGGIVPTDVTWSNLTKPYGHRHGSYRQHPAFDERSLAAALARGTDPAGNSLDSTMPRFVLGKEELKALVAFLKRLDSDLIPGVDDGTIRITTVLPLTGPDEATGRDMQALLQAIVQNLNASGGIYSRRIELTTVEMGPRPEATVAKLRKLLELDQTFAVLTPYAPGQESALTDLLEKTETPYVAPLTDFPDANSRIGFFLMPDLETRARQLLDYASSRLQGRTPRLTLIHQDSPAYRRAAEHIAAEALARGWPAPSLVRQSQNEGNLASAIQLQGADLALFLGNEDALNAWAGQAHEGPMPELILFAGLPRGRIGRDLPQPILERLIAVPAWAEVNQPTEEFRKLQRGAGVGDRSLYPESWAQAGARLMAEALKQSGRDLSRRKFIAALENLSHVQAPPWPALSFSPSRHVGLETLPVHAVDPQTQRLLPVNSR